MARHICESRRVRWLVAVMMLGAVILYIAEDYTGFMHEQDQAVLQQSTETFHALHVDFHAAIEQNVANNNPDEIFIRHDGKGGWENFAFTTPMTLEERLRRSSILSSRGTRSMIDASTTRSGKIFPSTSSTIMPNPNVQDHVLSNSIPVRNQNIDGPVELQQLRGAQQQQQQPQQIQQKQQQQQQVFTRPSVDVVPKVRVTDVNCAKLFDYDDNEHKLAQQYQKDNQKVPIPDEEYSKLTQDCDKFKRERQYILQPLSEEEADFSIAFSLVVFKDVEQIERLLRAIYRPQNYYCLHVDTKSNQKVKDAITNLANCFENVFLSSRSVDVQWGWFSVVEPELVCMQDLLKYKKWKYFINLTGQEWPLKTNADIVKILKVFNGANSMEGTVKRRNVERTQFVHNGYWSTDKKKDSPPPKGITITKGSIHITVSRAFVEYLFNDPLAKEFTEWLKDTGVPDETLFTSLNHSPDLGVPGAYKGEPETDPLKYPFITRFKNWGTYPFDYPCKGQRVRMVCIWSAGDLPLLRTRPELFTNKFYLDYEPLAYDCMEELHYNRTREEVLGVRQFSTLYYQQLGFVKNHV